MPQLIGTATGNVLRSTDTGQTWTNVLTRAGNTAYVSMVGNFAVAVSQAGGSGDYAYYSADSGATWPYQTAGGGASAVLADGHLVTMGYIAASGQSYVTSVDGGATQAAGGQLFSNAAGTVREAGPVALMPDGSGIVFASDGVYSTADFGVTWSSIATPAASVSPKEQFHAAPNGAFYAGPHGTAGVAIIDAATFAGHFSAVPSSGDVRGVAISSTGTIMACGLGGLVWKSTDQGATWATITTPVSAQLNDVTYLGDDDYLMAVGASGTIIISTDGGATWTTLASGTTDSLWTVAGITDTLPPHAPVLTSPIGGTVIDLGAQEPFTWSPSPASSSPQSAVTANDLRYKAVSAPTWTTISGLGSQGSYLLPANTLTAGQYQWEARSYSAAGAGPWSLDGYFTAAVRPATPTITEPASDAVIGGASMPVVWTTGTAQTKYQVRVMPDSGGQASGSPLYDSGQVVSTVQAVTVPATWNGSAVHVQVRAMDSGGLWSNWADVPVTINWQPPATPQVTLTPDEDRVSATGGSILIQVTNPTPTGNEPDPDTNVVWIIEGASRWKAAILGKDGSWRYWTPQSGVNTGVQVVASASATGVQAESEIAY